MDRSTKILDVAERRMRQSGYNAVSYRDIAAEIGIKSASLHYHFPKKEDLGMALVHRYTDNFRTTLERRIAMQSKPQDHIKGFVDIYASELKEAHLICLCAVLGAEAKGLPKKVIDSVKKFFDENIAWLTQTYEACGLTNAPRRAHVTLSLLEGAMIISAVKEDFAVFDAAADMILNDLKS